MVPRRPSIVPFQVTGEHTTRLSMIRLRMQLFTLLNAFSRGLHLLRKVKAQTMEKHGTLALEENILLKFYHS